MTKLLQYASDLNDRDSIPLNALNKKPVPVDSESGFGADIPHARNSTKAQIRLEKRDGKHIIIKDYSGSNPLIKFCYGRFTLRREAKAYSKLSGTAGFPDCYGLEGKDILLLEYIQGRPLSCFRRGEVPESVFDKLDRLIFLMHSRGVVNCDLHRSNVLLTKDDVYMVDFASALIFNKLKSPGLIARLLMQLDLHAAAKIRARYLKKQKPAPKGVFGVLYITLRYFKSFRRIFKLF